MDYQDLFQEGMSSLLERKHTLDVTKSKEQADSFLKFAIKSGMLDYVAYNTSDVKGNKNKFFEGQIYQNVEYDDGEVVLTSMNPEDLYVLFEDRAMLDDIIEKFEATITDPLDEFVWYNVIKTDEPMTTREAAEAMNVKSNKTISNRRQKLEERFDAMYRGEEYESA